MAYVVRVPGLGMQQDRATLLGWHASAGDSVSEGELLAEIETEKSVFEVNAKEGGVLRRIYAEEGDVRTPNQPLGIVAGADEDVSGLESNVEESGGDIEASAETESDASTDESGASTGMGVGENGTAGPSKVTPRARKRADELGVEVATVEGTGPDGAVMETDVERAAESSESASEKRRARVAPKARRRAEELGVDLAGVEGTGPDGAVMVEDVEAAAEQGNAIREKRPFSEMRRTIARRLHQSYRDAVHVTLDRSADAEAALDAADAAAETLGVDVSILDILLVALSETLTEHPEFNATVEDETLTLYEKQNVGMAVDVERGLVTPVLDDVAAQSLEEISVERRELTERVLADEFTPADLEGGTFTVTNLGPYGIESFDPVINPPQVAILGVNALEERTASVGGSGTRRLRRHLPLSLSFDHRAVDGADAARFLETLVDHLEDPWPLLPESVTPRTETATLPGRSVSAETAGGVSGVVTAGSFEWSFDEPSALGGSGTAPSPVDYLVGALASCLAASIGFQAEKRDVALSAVRVDVDGHPERGSLESVTVTVALESDADDESLDRLVELGERGCYVHEALREDLSVEIRWDRR